jgi:hypothetical protein
MWHHILSQGYYISSKALISLYIFLFPLCETDVYGQSSDSSQSNVINHQVWIDIYPHFYVNEKFEYYGDAGYRTDINENIWSRIHVRPSVRFHLNKAWEAHGGIGLFYTFQKYDINRFEISPWQGIKLKWPETTHIGFNHLARIEERISYTTNNWQSSFSLRFRYKLAGKIKFCTKCSLQNVYIPFYGEIFLPVNDDIDEFFRNQGRAGIGLGYNVLKDWRFSLIMNWQKSRAGPEDEFDVTDYILQLKIFKRWESRLLKK